METVCDADEEAVESYILDVLALYNLSTCRLFAHGEPVPTPRNAP